MQNAAFAILMLSCLVTATHGFLPTWYAKLLLFSPEKFKLTKTHSQITKEAHRSVVAEELSLRSDDFPEPSSSYTETNIFREAVQQFLSGVQEIDSLFRPYAPKEHVDGEEIYPSHDLLRQLIGRIRSDIAAGNMYDARRLTGNALHTLQDFYSHSNWVEMGNDSPNDQFGSELNAYIGQIAGPDERTCTDCSETDCLANSDPADLEDKLTTGYFTSRFSFGSEPKPAGKCSHGGLFDKSASQTPVGGINKDTLASYLSPHYDKHSKAADIAILASIQFIKNIRDQADPTSPIRNDQFDEFLGLGSNWTLCFVIDTTGSMSDEIEAVRSATINLVDATASGARKPGDYVLVPFNDPDYGPAMETKNPSEMITWLNGLYAAGGGDFPEMSMHGMWLAAGAARSTSTCYVYTDASAKDLDLYPVVKTLALTKSIKFEFLLTNDGFRRRKRRSSSRQKRSVFSYYDDLASSTGGSVLHVTKTEVANATVSVLSAGSRTQKVTLFIANNVARNFQFYVDATLDSIVIQLSGYTQVVNVTAPSGMPFGGYTLFSNTVDVKLYNFGKLTPGLWSVAISGFANSVLVTGSSQVNFAYKFTVDTEGSHGGYQEITGLPVADTSYYILVTLNGAMDSLSGASTNLVSKIVELAFVSTNGTILTKMNLLELAPLENYITTSTQTPRSAFYVAAGGIDSKGNAFVRFDQAIITPAMTSVILEITQNTTLTLSPGSSILVCINVTNNGLAGATSWYLRVSDTQSYYSGSSPISVFLEAGASAVECLSFSSPSNVTTSNGVSSVTVTVGRASATSVDNYLAFYLTTAVNQIDNCSTAGVCDVFKGTTQTTATGTGSGPPSPPVPPAYTAGVDPLPDADVNTTSEMPLTVSTSANANRTYKPACCGAMAIEPAVPMLYKSLIAVTVISAMLQ